MKQQLLYAIKSFESQKYTSLNIIGAEVATAFNNASDKGDPAWLIQWVINNKLVCNIILHSLFRALTN